MAPAKKAAKRTRKTTAKTAVSKTTAKEVVTETPAPEVEGPAFPAVEEKKARERGPYFSV